MIHVNNAPRITLRGVALCGPHWAGIASYVGEQAVINPLESSTCSLK